MKWYEVLLEDARELQGPKPMEQTDLNGADDREEWETVVSESDGGT